MLLPLAFYCVMPALFVVSAMSSYYYYAYNDEESDHYNAVASKLFLTVEILGPVTNCISCLILALVIRLINKLSNQAESDLKSVATKRKVNSLVTGSHIGVTLAYTAS